MESPSKCIVCLPVDSGQSDQGRRAAVRQFNALISESATRLGGMLEGAVEEDDVIGSGFPPIQLLHLAIADDVDPSPEYLPEMGRPHGSRGCPSNHDDSLGRI